MDNETEVLDPQTEVQEEEAPEAIDIEELNELKRRAEVSSQNYERAKKAEAKEKALLEEIELLKTQGSYVGFGDDQLSAKVAEIEQKLKAQEERVHLDGVLAKYPVLADKREAFDAYRADYPVEKLDVVAKLFLAENDLLTAQPARKGLEPARGGRRTPPDNGKMSSEDVKRLRTENYKEYMKLLRSGKLNI